jgi:hypothetical protein
MTQLTNPGKKKIVDRAEASQSDGKLMMYIRIAESRYLNQVDIRCHFVPPEFTSRRNMGPGDTESWAQFVLRTDQEGCAVLARTVIATETGSAFREIARYRCAWVRV